VHALGDSRRANELIDDGDGAPLDVHAVVAEHAEDERDKHGDLGDSALMYAGTAAGSAMQVRAR
jgi:hypothetical protein